MRSLGVYDEVRVVFGLVWFGLVNWVCLTSACTQRERVSKRTDATQSLASPLLSLPQKPLQVSYLFRLVGPGGRLQFGTPDFPY